MTSKPGHLLLPLALSFLAAPALRSQAPTAAAPPEVTVCQVLEKPADFNGKIVTLKSVQVIAGFDTFEIVDHTCKQPINGIWLDYPDGTRGKAGPVELVYPQAASNASFNPPAAPATPVSLSKDKNWGDFDKALSTPARTKGLCLGCVANTVTATLVGRIDGVATAGIERDAQGKPSGISGFGNLRQYRARLVIQSVVSVEAHPIDYSKVADIAPAPAASADSGGGGRRGGGGGGGAAPGAFGTDPAAIARAQASAYPSGSSLNTDLSRAGNVFPKLGDPENGVSLIFGNSNANEAKKSEEKKASGKSPDGVAYLCYLDQDRLKGDLLTIALTHAGAEVADLRDTSIGGPALLSLEVHAWKTTLYSALANRERSLAIAGGFLLWDNTWQGSATTENANGAMREYFATLSVNTDVK